MSILLTGLTGVVGSYLAPILAQKTEVFCLVRNGKSRVRNGKLWGIPDTQIIDGDISENGCGLNERDVLTLQNKGINQIIHAAASIKFDAKLSEKVWQINYNGTKNILELAHTLNVKAFHYISTAYASTQRNPYEASKAETEKLVKQSNLAYSIYRLAIIVGHSKTGYIKSFDGLYGYFAGLYRIAKKERQKQNLKTQHIELPIYLECSSNSTLNIVPIDWVMKILIGLIEIPPINQSFSITHPNPPQIKIIMEQSINILGISGIKFYEPNMLPPVHPEHRWQVIQKRISKQLKRYRPYITEEEPFCVKNTQAALGNKYISPPLITKEILSVLLNYAKKNNFGASH